MKSKTKISIIVFSIITSTILTILTSSDLIYFETEGYSHIDQSALDVITIFLIIFVFVLFSLFSIIFFILEIKKRLKTDQKMLFIEKCGIFFQLLSIILIALTFISGNIEQYYLPPILISLCIGIIIQFRKPNMMSMALLFGGIALLILVFILDYSSVGMVVISE